MNIDQVITQFETEHKGKFSLEDRQTIVEAVEDLGLTEFSIKYRNDVKTADGGRYSVYFFDESDFIHVHPTMIVGRKEFKGSQPGKHSKYHKYPHFADLSNWIQKSGHRQPPCPHCFIEIPLVGVCGLCGLDLENVDDQ